MKSLIFVCETNEGTTTANGHPLVMLVPEADPDVFQDKPKGGLEFVVTNPEFKHDFKQNRRYEVSFRLLSDVIELPGDTPPPAVVGDEPSDELVAEEPAPEPVVYEKDQPSVDDLETGPVAAPKKRATKKAPAKK